MGGTARKNLKRSEPFCGEGDDRSATAPVKATRRVGVEHLLLALCREPHGIAADILNEIGLTQDIADRVLRVIDSPGYGAAGSNEIRSNGELVGRMVEIDGELAAVDLDGNRLE